MSRLPNRLAAHSLARPANSFEVTSVGERAPFTSARRETASRNMPRSSGAARSPKRTACRTSPSDASMASSAIKAAGMLWSSLRLH